MRASGKRLILLEPRRLAARAAASRMAATLGEEVGETIGLRVRPQSLVSKRTRNERSLNPQQRAGQWVAEDIEAFVDGVNRAKPAGG